MRQSFTKVCLLCLWTVLIKIFFRLLAVLGKDILQNTAAVSMKLVSLTDLQRREPPPSLQTVPRGNLRLKHKGKQKLNKWKNNVKMIIISWSTRTHTSIHKVSCAYWCYRCAKSHKATYYYPEMDCDSKYNCFHMEPRSLQHTLP